ncbi:hypothetical protein Hbor_38950 (plasmid) [Halogeometricum borinquense DSM 11551]|uniref:Uncharacterized protein n=1 Tax=Halogeometricum borinquense (strain ATCC 700274 / DSM 11551 / JCM 10706 / KCTC 4070 / PR3) TaxID=469382 RepID=E4NVY9_HALBP|nr:hypothetical protein Hbor_38950 [Halogeometricum borinquense DSM 11551]
MVVELSQYPYYDEEVKFIRYSNDALFELSKEMAPSPMISHTDIQSWYSENSDTDRVP